jgi:SWIM zinc finger
MAKQGSSSLHSNLPTANTLTELGNGLVEAQWKQKEHYDVCGPFGYDWHCLRRKEVAPTPTMPRKIPQFVRVRTVKLCSASNQLTCSCQYFERVGIPCRHIMKVMSAVLGSSYEGVTLKDVRVFWSRDYYFHGLDLSPQSVQRKPELLARCKDDIKGPTLQMELSTVPVIRNDNIIVQRGKPT